MRIGIQLSANKKKYESFLYLLNNKINSNVKIDYIHIKNDLELKKYISEIDVLATYAITEEIFSKKSDKLKWIHFGAAGIDKNLFPAMLKSKVIVTNSKGIHANPVSEFCIGMILYLSKQFIGCEDFKKTKKWTQWDLARQTIQLQNKTIGIIGYGKIGKAIAKKAKLFDMEVIATRRLQKKIECKKTVDKLLPISNLSYLISNSDFIVIACPLTPLTKGMIGINEFALMKKSAFIVNIARGSIIDEKELITVLKNNKIAGAALDVFEEEPLNTSSELFNLDNVFLSPHISGNFHDYQVDVVVQFADNLNRFIKGKTLINRVCKKRLY